MRLNEYQALAQRTSRDDVDKLLNGAMGLCGEAGEVMDLVKKHMMQGHDLDTDRVAEEISDILWYCAEAATGIGWMLDDIAQLNIDKLKRRYPEGFAVDRSVNREV